MNLVVSVTYRNPTVFSAVKNCITSRIALQGVLKGVTGSETRTDRLLSEPEFEFLKFYTIGISAAKGLKYLLENPRMSFLSDVLGWSKKYKPWLYDDLIEVIK